MSSDVSDTILCPVAVKTRIRAQKFDFYGSACAFDRNSSPPLPGQFQRIHAVGYDGNTVGQLIPSQLASEEIAFFLQRLDST